MLFRDCDGSNTFPVLSDSIKYLLIAWTIGVVFVFFENGRMRVKCRLSVLLEKLCERSVKEQTFFTAAAVLSDGKICMNLGIRVTQNRQS